MLDKVGTIPYSNAHHFRLWFSLVYIITATVAAMAMLKHEFDSIYALEKGQFRLSESEPHLKENISQYLKLYNLEMSKPQSTRNIATALNAYKAAEASQAMLDDLISQKLDLEKTRETDKTARYFIAFPFLFLLLGYKLFKPAVKSINAQQRMADRLLIAKSKVDLDELTIRQMELDKILRPSTEQEESKSLETGKD